MRVLMPIGVVQKCNAPGRAHQQLLNSQLLVSVVPDLG